MPALGMLKDRLARAEARVKRFAHELGEAKSPLHLMMSADEIIDAAADIHVFAPAVRSIEVGGDGEWQAVSRTCTRNLLAGARRAWESTSATTNLVNIAIVRSQARLLDIVDAHIEVSEG